MGGSYTHMGDMRNSGKVLDGKSERNIPLGRPRHILEDKMKVGHKEGWGVWDGFIWLRTGTFRFHKR
jgi:hypothetical protein